MGHKAIPTFPEIKGSRDPGQNVGAGPKSLVPGEWLPVPINDFFKQKAPRFSLPGGFFVDRPCSAPLGAGSFYFTHPGDTFENNVFPRFIPCLPDSALDRIDKTLNKRIKEERQNDVK
jgi:hypothetical protein